MQTYDTFIKYFSYEYIIRISSDIKLIYPALKYEIKSNDRTIDHQLFNERVETERRIMIDEHFKKAVKID